jgi:AcrR family transcriptional regulator
MRSGQRKKAEPGGTPRRILEHARRAFDERGVGAVGIREIARDLDLSPGNVSYHFPTKESLVAALVEEAHAENNALFAALAEPLDFPTVDRIICTIMRRDLENRWLMRDAVGLTISLPTLRPLHKRMQRTREARVDGIVAGLTEAGLLDRNRVKRALPLLRQQVLTQVFFWLPAAILAAPDRDPAERLDVHARAVLALFLASCTPAGRRQLDALLRPEPSTRAATPLASAGSAQGRRKGGGRGRSTPCRRV